MKRFNIDAVKEGDILCGRNMVSKGGEQIRTLMGCAFGNHNAPIIKHNTRGWGIGDMCPPCGTFVHFSHYEDLVESGDYMVRVLRIKDATDAERHMMSHFWQTKIDQEPYSSFHVKRLWVYRFWHSLKWRIQGMWCTRAVAILCGCVFPPERNPFRKLFIEGMPLKKNQSPRTVENRLVQGLLIDVTDEVFTDDTTP